MKTSAIVVLLLLLTGGCGSKKQEANPLGIDPAQIAGQGVPYEMWGRYGQPVTMPGTDGVYWCAYLPDANLSFVSLKKPDVVIYAGFGRTAAMEWLSERRKTVQSLFSPSDGTHRGMVEQVKDKLGRPAGFEVVSTHAEDYGQTVLVRMTYRYRKGLNMVEERAEALVRMEDGQAVLRQ